jgi:hypothetical protein
MNNIFCFLASFPYFEKIGNKLMRFTAGFTAPSKQGFQHNRQFFKEHACSRYALG